MRKFLESMIVDPKSGELIQNQMLHVDYGFAGYSLEYAKGLLSNYSHEYFRDLDLQFFCECLTKDSDLYYFWATNCRRCYICREK